MSLDASAPPVPAPLASAPLASARPLDLTAGLTTPRGTDYYLLSELLTHDAREIRDRVRNFVDTQMLPIINDYWERAQFPFELVPKIAQLGVVGGAISGYGCPGPSRFAAGMVTLELSRGDGNVNTFLGVQNGLAMGSINMLGSEEQKQRWLPAMAWLDKVDAFALTEPGHGTAQINFAGAAEVVDSLHFRPITDTFARAAEVDPRRTRVHPPTPVDDMTTIAAPADSASAAHRIPSAWKPPRGGTVTTGPSTAPSGGSVTATSRMW